MAPASRHLKPRKARHGLAKASCSYATQGPPGLRGVSVIATVVLSLTQETGRARREWLRWCWRMHLVLLKVPAREENGTFCTSGPATSSVLYAETSIRGSEGYVLGGRLQWDGRRRSSSFVSPGSQGLSRGGSYHLKWPDRRIDLQCRAAEQSEQSPETTIISYVTVLPAA